MTLKLEKMLLKRKLEATSEFVFINPKTNLPYVDIKKSFASLMKDAGIPDFTFHCFRHTGATKILEESGDIIATKDILGHADIKTTMIYQHLNEERKRNALLKANL